jgi:hypothetical protein
VVKLSPSREAELLNEMKLAELFTERAWMARYGVSARTLRRLRAKVRQHQGSLAALGPDTVHILCLNNSMSKKVRAA